MHVVTVVFIILEGFPYWYSCIVLEQTVKQDCNHNRLSLHTKCVHNLIMVLSSLHSFKAIQCILCLILMPILYSNSLGMRLLVYSVCVITVYYRA